MFKVWIAFGTSLVLMLGASFLFSRDHDYSNVTVETSAVEEIQQKIVEAEEAPPKNIATHVETPEFVRALYMTNWVAGTPSIRDHVLAVADAKDMNTLMIDVKDATGYVGYDFENKLVDEVGAEQMRVRNLKELIKEQHELGRYLIARIVVFQDPVYAAKYPNEAIKTQAGELWRDRKGLAWVDPGSEKYWEYIVELSKASHEIGFDEINFDYIRFPTDGDISNAVYPHSQDVLDTYTDGKVRKLEEFFKYLDQEMRRTGITTSADIFGVAVAFDGDNGIGQQYEMLLPYFDYIAPMVYPSHFYGGYAGYENPALYPYEVLMESLGYGMSRLEALESTPTTLASVQGKINKVQIRPWIQDFDLGAEYTPAMVQAQLDAVDDLGLSGYMIWDASNRYSGTSGL